MSIVENYTLSKNRGPVFNYPNNMNHSYAKIDYQAASIDDACDIINTTLNNISSLIPDLESIKNEIIELSDLWNNFVKLDEEGLECVFMDDLNKNIASISESADSGKTECNSLLYEFSATIDEINAYIVKLNENYDMVAKLKEDRNNYLKKMNDYTLNEDERLNYVNLYRHVNNLISNYSEIKNLDDFGRWVKKI